MANDEKVYELLEKQTAILSMLAQKDSGGDGLQFKGPSPGNASTNQPLHGPGGLFTGPGLSRDVITTRVRPQGIATRLPLLPTNRTSPLYGAVTGYEQQSGDMHPTNSCEPAATGTVKTATLTSKLGLTRMDSNVIDMDEVMLTLHRGDFTDLQLRGDVLGLDNLNPAATNQRDILNLVTSSEMVIMGVALERNLSRQLWQGTVQMGDTLTNGEFPGLDSQIATGQVDALTNVPVPALDSDVKDFGLDVIGSGTGRDIVEYLGMLEFYLRYNAERMGAGDVSYIITMRPELWHELSAVWPCAYNTTKCVNSAVGAGGASQTIIDGRENVRERDNMRSSMTLQINGRSYPVVTDNGIFEQNGNNSSIQPGRFASSIYMLPLRAYGMSVLYREYLDYRLASRDVSFAQGKLNAWWTDNGVYAWALTQNKWCYQFHAKTQQRVVLRAPHLAGRIDNVAYEPLQHLREDDPVSPYFYDGGVSIRGIGNELADYWSGGSYQAVWN